jgi:nicotinamidase-related amidase
MEESQQTQSLHGMVPDKSSVALLLIDVINDLEFEGAEKLERYVLPMAERIAHLKKRAKKAGIPVIYVNDNYGKWQSDFTKLVDHCLGSDVRGKKLVETLRPDEDDYFVLKPKHSGFFSTNLEVLLKYLNARTVILAGVAGNICILFTANDAYMRDMGLFVPSDCCASNEQSDNDNAPHPDGDDPQGGYSSVPGAGAGDDAPRGGPGGAIGTFDKRTGVTGFTPPPATPRASWGRGE